MGQVREHSPVVIEEINGLWDRGDAESCPSDHLLKADNIEFFHSGIETRKAVAPYSPQQFASSLKHTRRVYNYVTQTGQTLLVLVEGGLLYHVISPTEVYNILNIAGMEDFAFISIAGRAYISPFKTYTNSSGGTYSLALPNEYVYVYYRDPATPVGTNVLARLAAGNPPSNGNKKPIIVFNNDINGKVTEGYHSFSVAFNDGLVEMSLRATVYATGGKTVRVTNIPVNGTATRTIVMTKAGIPYAPGTVNQVFKVVTLTDHTITSYVVDVADSELVAYVPGAGAAPPLEGLIVFNPPDPGFCDVGFHLFAVVFETDTGYLSAPGPETYGGQTLVDTTKTVTVMNVPIGPALTNPARPSPVVKRHIVATKTIPEYSGDQKGYQFFFIPKGTLENNTATTINVNFYDSDLIADASHLIDNFPKIPAGVNFCEYHSRLVIVGDSSHPKKLDGTTEDLTKPDNRSVAWVSAPGEPEAINQIDGILITTLDGNPLTNCQDFRDNLYLFKSTRTYAYSDNGDEPATWEMEVLDQGIGASVHGIAEVLDSGGVNTDYLIITDWSGLMLFNGTYARPELSWKIENTWIGWDKNLFHHLQIVNDSIRKKIWILDPHAPTKILYLADYGNGLNPKDIRWAKWWFTSSISSIALYKIDKLVLGTTQV